LPDNDLTREARRILRYTPHSSDHYDKCAAGWDGQEGDPREAARLRALAEEMRRLISHPVAREETAAPLPVARGKMLGPIMSCRECPYHDNLGFVWIDGEPMPGLGHENSWVCQHKEALELWTRRNARMELPSAIHIPDFPAIPPWCPLRDWI
jgi:hypothetical protein